MSLRCCSQTSLAIANFPERRLGEVPRTTQPVEKVGAELKIIRNQAPEELQKPPNTVCLGPDLGPKRASKEFSTG